MGGKTANMGADDSLSSEPGEDEVEIDDHEFFEEMEEEMEDELGEEFEPVHEPGPNTREQFESWEDDPMAEEPMWEDEA